MQRVDGVSFSFLILALVAGCPAPDHPSGDPDASAAQDASVISEQMYFQVPGEGDIAAPGDTIAVRLYVPNGGETPVLQLAGSKLPVSWTQDGAVYWCNIQIPTGLTQRDADLVATVKDDDAVVHLKVLTSINSTAEVSIASGDTVLTLGPALTVRIPAGVLGGGAASLRQYDATNFPALEGAQLLSPVYRLDLSAFPEEIHGDISVEQSITAAMVNSILSMASPELRVQVIEGDDATGEVAPWSGPAALALYTDGSGVIGAKLPPQAFHRKGSSTTRWAVLLLESPVGVEDLKLCKTKADGSETCKGFISSGDPESFNIASESDKLELKAEVKWAASPPSFSNPLGNLRVTSPFDAYRVLTGDLARWLAETRRRMAAQAGTAPAVPASSPLPPASGARRGADPDERAALATVLRWIAPVPPQASN